MCRSPFPNSPRLSQLCLVTVTPPFRCQVHHMTLSSCPRTLTASTVSTLMSHRLEKRFLQATLCCTPLVNNRLHFHCKHHCQIHCLHRRQLCPGTIPLYLNPPHSQVRPIAAFHLSIISNHGRPRVLISL
jgi:hypothetical protein